MIMEKHKQLFTSCVGEVEGWCPIDHVFYAQYDWTPERGLSEARENKVAHLEAVGDKYIVVKYQHYEGGGHGTTIFDHDDLPSALRQFADLIEADTKNENPPANG